MDFTHVHLVLNHVPVLGTLFGVLLLLASGIRRSDELKRAALALFMLAALAAIPPYLTGESAEERIEQLPGGSESILEKHEDAALGAIVTLEILGVVSLGGIFLVGRTIPLAKAVVTAVLLLSMATAGLMTRTANLGGQIRHSEIRQVTADPPATGSEGRPNARTHGEADD